MDTRGTQDIEFDGPHDKPRRKLLEAALELFAAAGYDDATVRDICSRAGVNTAAINYHFGDKRSLYAATLQYAMTREKRPCANAAGLESIPPEEALRAYLERTFQHLGQIDRPAFYTQVMIHELTAPTEGLSSLVDHVVRPRVGVLCGIVGRLLDLPADHDRTRLAVISILGQALYYVQSQEVIRLLWPEWRLSLATMDEVIEHIFRFSVLALRSMREGKPQGDASAAMSDAAGPKIAMGA